MATEKDAGRDLKLTAALVLGGIVSVICGGYFFWTWLSAAPPASSKIELDRVQAAGRTKTAESQAYTEMLALFNESGAEEARRQDKSFIASIPLHQEQVVKPAAIVKQPVQAAPTSRPSRRVENQAPPNTGKQEDNKAELEKLIARIGPAKGGSVVVATALGAMGPGGAGSGDGSIYQNWSETLPGGRSRQVSIDGSQNIGFGERVPVEVVPPYWRGPGVIDIGVDSDNGTTPVLGKFKSGPLVGAVLKAPEGARLVGEGVVIHFTEMFFNGVNYKIDAYPLKDDTLLANVASEVNNRYLERIVIPAFLKGIGGVGEMYSQANTQVVSNGFSTQTVRPGTPDGSAVMGAIAGGTAAQAGKVLAEDAARIPAKQVKVNPGEVVAIQFMRGVYSGDAIAPGKGGEGVRPAIRAEEIRTAPAQAPSTSDEWRTQTQARIQAQRRLQEINQ